MSLGTVSVRYAKALLQYATENADDKQVYAEMQILATRMRKLRSIHDRIVDPTLTVSEKCNLLETVVTDNVSNISSSLKAFFKLVVEANRSECLLLMATSYQQLYRQAHDLVPVQLITAVPISESSHSRLKQIVESVEHGTIEWTHTVEPEIEGGFVLQVDGYRLDVSVARQLQQIRKEWIDKNNRII